MNQDLRIFIKESLEKGMKRQDIAQVLGQAGWDQAEVGKALASFADIDFAVPVPRKQPYLQAKEAFLYLVSFITLYISAFSFGQLVFAFINQWFPDALRGGSDPFSSAMRMAIASLVVSFPLYLFVMRILKRGMAKDPERRESKIRKWLSYITLVGAAAILIGDVISLVFHLLGGELTIPFLAKSLTIFTIAGVLFGYYLSDLHKEETEQ